MGCTSGRSPSCPKGCEFFLNAFAFSISRITQTSQFWLLHWSCGLEKAASSPFHLERVVAFQCGGCPDSCTDNQIQPQAAPRTALSPYVFIEIAITVVFAAANHSVAVVMDATRSLNCDRKKSYHENTSTPKSQFLSLQNILLR